MSILHEGAGMCLIVCCEGLEVVRDLAVDTRQLHGLSWRRLRA